MGAADTSHVVIGKPSSASTETAPEVEPLAETTDVRS